MDSVLNFSGNSNCVASMLQGAIRRKEELHQRPLPMQNLHLFSTAWALAPVLPLRSSASSFCAQRPLPNQNQFITQQRAILRCCSTQGSSATGSTGQGQGDILDVSEEMAVIAEEEEELTQLVFLNDPLTGRSLQCGVDQVVELDGVEYLMCYPRHEPVFFAEVNEENDLVEVEDGPDFRAMIPIASAVLSEDHIELQDTPFVLTINEDLALDQIEDDEDDEDDDDGESDFGGLDDDDDDDIDENNVEVVSEFQYEGRHILIAKPLEATLLVAEKRGDDLRVIIGDELDRISPKLENVMV